MHKDSNAPPKGTTLRDPVRFHGRPMWSSAPRTWACNVCERRQEGAVVPAGWYRVERTHPYDRTQRILRLGLYCSSACLAAAMGDIARGEQAFAARHATAVEPSKNPAPASADDHDKPAKNPGPVPADGRRPTVNRAVAILAQGATVTVAARRVGVPTGVLTRWLTDAGVRLSGGVLPADARQALS